MATVAPTNVRDGAETWFRENWDPELPLGHWWERLADGGWGFPTWPERWFGRGLRGQHVLRDRHGSGRHRGASGMAAVFGGGSDQIQRNILGERVLGLPGEPRVDEDVPFAELKVGTQR